MIQIIKGTFGYFDGKKVVPKTKADGPLSLDPELEKRLVEKKVAVYVDNSVDKPEGNPKSNLPAYNTSMKLDELKEAAKAYGIDASTLRSKADIIAAIDESIGNAGTDDDQNGDDDAPPSLNAVDAVQ